MATFEEITEEEAPGQSQTSTSPSSKLTVKEILATKTQHYFAHNKRTEAILIQVAFSIGSGSMWRFPYLCHQNGGGDFILMYLFMLLLFGIPLLYMEMIMGQWLRVDNTRLWKQLVPWLGGIGYASILVCLLVSVYNSIIISWSFSYLGKSFNHPLPWDRCPQEKSINAIGLSCLQTVPHQYFWYHTILNASSYMEEGVRALVPNLVLGTFGAWSLLFLIISVGIKISLPSLIFSVFLPYIILLCLLLRGVFLEGAAASLRRMVTTELSGWASLDLWRRAGGHVLYSMGLGLGTVINISCKAGGNNYVKVASLIALVNLVTSLLSTSIIFIVLGFWTTNSGQACVEKSIENLMDLMDKGMLPQNIRPTQGTLPLPPQDYLNWIENLPHRLKYQVIHFSPSCSIKAQDEKFMQSPGLVFAAFSQAVSLLPGASFWAILSFLVLVITGLSNLTKLLEGIVFPLQDSSSIFKKDRLLLSAVVCLGGFLGSLVFTSHPGTYIMSLFDEHLVPLILVIIVTFQNMTLAWVYGANRFREEMFSDLGHLLWSFFIFLWCYVTLPGLLALLTISFMSLYQSPPSYYIAWNHSLAQEVKQPYMQSTLGWAIFLIIFTFLPVPIYPLHQWWYLQDHVVSNHLEMMQSKKLTAVPTKPSLWPKHPFTKSNFMSQERRSKNSLNRFSLPLTGQSHLDSSLQVNLPWSRHGAQSSSGFSLPRFSSLASTFSFRSSSLSTSRQVSPTSTTVANSERGREAEGEPVDKKSSQ